MLSQQAFERSLLLLLVFFTFRPPSSSPSHFGLTNLIHWCRIQLFEIDSLILSIFTPSTLKSIQLTKF